MNDPRVHIIHVVHRFDVGGMENGVVNLVNRLPARCFRHSIVALTTIGTIADRVSNPEVELLALGLPPGPLSAHLPKLWRLFRRLRPTIVHTRNVGTLEAQFAAALAGVPVRIHGEHGWEVHDLVGSNSRLLRTRRWLRRLVHAQIALSTPTFEYLRDRVDVPLDRLVSIPNGVDTERFRPRKRESDASAELVIGYAGRLAAVKNPLLLIEALERVRALLEGVEPSFGARVHLELIGDGPLAEPVRRRVAASPSRHAIRLVGERDDIPERMRNFDIYALPSQAEGISNTLLEAMATGLPCVATRVGGNEELIEHQRCGTLVASGDAAGLAQALERYLRDPGLRVQHGSRARERVVERFGLDRMIDSYRELYTTQLMRRRALPHGWPRIADGLDGAGHAVTHSSAG